MRFVVDASIAATWLLADESHAKADAAYALFPDEEAIAPSLWWFEMRNLVLTNERRGRIEMNVSTRMLTALANLPIQLDHAPDDAVLMDLARQHGLTAYDAAYLELALRIHAPLATLDDALARAARSEGLRLIGEN